MMNIPATPPGSGADAAASSAKDAGAHNAGGSGPADFMALLGALTTLAPESGSGAPAADGAEDSEEDAGEGGEDAAALLAGLGFGVLLAPAPPPTQAAALQGARAEPLARNAPGVASKLVAAELLASRAGELVGLLEAEEGAAPLSLTDDSSASTAPNASLNAWAGAANRVASGQEAYSRPAAAADGQLREPVGTPRWKDELGAQLTLMNTQGRHSGSLRLSPEHLGPLEIQITVGEDKTTHVQFGAQQAETRAALQDALPRLREMFAAAGLQLGDAGVSNGQAPNQRPQDPFAAPDADGVARDGESTLPGAHVRSVTHSGMLDLYA